jgi:hypothetical protein
MISIMQRLYGRFSHIKFRYCIRIDAYNTALSVIDSSKTEIDQLEKTLADVSDKMLIGVAFKYGKDSSEYEMAGGVRIH